MFTPAAHGPRYHSVMHAGARRLLARCLINRGIVPYAFSQSKKHGLA